MSLASREFTVVERIFRSTKPLLYGKSCCPSSKAAGLTKKDKLDEMHYPQVSPNGA